MTDHPFDRLTRRLSGTTSRRQALAALGALAAARRHPTQAATQLQVATCGAAGAVCTHLKGCCEGVVCATSHINPNYGLCIPGKGTHATVTTQLVVPESDGVLEQQTAELAEAEADGAAAAETVLAEQEAAQDSRRSTRRSRQDTDRSKKRSRKDTHRSKKRSRRTSDTSLTDDPDDTDDTDEDTTSTE